LKRKSDVSISVFVPKTVVAENRAGLEIKMVKISTSDVLRKEPKMLFKGCPAGMGVWDVAILWPASPTSIHVRAEAELTRATDAATANREPIIRFMLGCVCRVLVFLKNVRRRNF
jgi:hypothetical protein